MKLYCSDDCDCELGYPDGGRPLVVSTDAEAAEACWVLNPKWSGLRYWGIHLRGRHVLGTDEDGRYPAAPRRPPPLELLRRWLERVAAARVTGSEPARPALG